ncbi:MULTISPECIES: hypothetical protein [Pseudomonas]|uniref:Tetratricopeptide repeat protein n=1 Tax=Pseudomonas rhodesiae TaxID=76760 RepID=A0A8I1JHS6_9PSED|nr:MULTISPECIES: hypothetical protein [Pseudomonas]MBI6605160.1 hypothetical protein [Pseudomonas sp. S4_EA_1b]MBI6628174.1 hypothetical protein [Pseudomonas rhodesiae]
MQLQAKSAIAEIFEERRRIRNCLAESYVLDEVASERLKKRVLKELQDPAISSSHRAALHHELGAILGTQGRVEEAIDHFSKAEHWGFDRIAVPFSIAFVYLSNGRVLDARSLIEKVYRDAPENILDLIKAHQAQAGMVGVFLDTTETKPPFIGDCSEAARILASRGIDDIELTKRLDTACSVIRRWINHPILGFKIFAQEGEGILYRYLVKAPIEDLMALNTKILDALMDCHDGPLDRELSICVTPWAPEDAGDVQEAYRVRIS